VRAALIVDDPEDAEAPEDAANLPDEPAASTLPR
jgi:hypothetical protein